MKWLVRFLTTMNFQIFALASEQPRQRGCLPSREGHGIPPCPSLLLASPVQVRQIFAVVYIIQPTLPKVLKKPLGQHSFFPTTPNSILFFSSKVSTFFYLPLKFQKLIYVFEASKLPKNSFGTLVLQGLILHQNEVLKYGNKQSMSLFVLPSLRSIGSQLGSKKTNNSKFLNIVKQKPLRDRATKQAIQT